MHKYSVIIPHKNIPKLLERCLKSIPDKQEIQVIVVDDNSTPDIVDFSNFPGSDRIYTQIIRSAESKGAGYARNIGLEHAKGDWILFADADDFFSYNAFITFDKYTSSDYDVIHFNYLSYNSDTLEPANRHVRYADIIKKFISNPSEENKTQLRYSIPVPWKKMIRHSVIKDNNIRFDESIVANDVIFSAKLGYYTDKHFADTSVVYNTTVRDGSLTNIKNKDTYYSRYLTALRYNQFVKKIGLPGLQHILTSAAIYALIYFGPKEFIKYINQARKHKVSLLQGFKYLWSSFLNWRKMKGNKKENLKQ